MNTAEKYEIYRMSVAIIDDEEIIREGIKDFITEQYPACDVVSFDSAAAACDAFNNSYPDVIITDIVMPVMNGIDFVKRLRSSSEDTKIIMISGYSEISYLKSAVEFNASDYIFKPVDISKLKTVLDKVFAKCSAEKAEKKQHEILIKKLDMGLPLLIDRLLLQLTEESGITREHALERIDFLDADFLYDYPLYVISFYFEEFNDSAHAQTYIDMIKRHIDSAFTENGRWLTGSHVFIKPENELVAILSQSFSQEDASFDLTSFIRDRMILAAHTLHSTAGCGFFAGISSPVTDFMDLARAYEQSLLALSARFNQETEFICFHDNMPKKDRVVSLCSETEKQLKNDLYSGNFDNVNESIDLIFSELISDESDALSLSEIKREISGLLVRLIKDFDINADERFYIENFNWNECFALESATQIKKWLRSKLKAVCHYSQLTTDNRTHAIVNRVKQIVETRYHEPICVKTISDELCISSNYLSSVFKKITGRNFIDYLTRIRLNKAKELLSDPSARIYEICAKVGYDDQNYFTKVFKKHFGVNPSRFLQQHSVSDQERTDY